MNKIAKKPESNLKNLSHIHQDYKTTGEAKKSQSNVMNNKTKYSNTLMNVTTGLKFLYSNKRFFAYCSSKTKEIPHTQQETGHRSF